MEIGNPRPATLGDDQPYVSEMISHRIGASRRSDCGDPHQRRGDGQGSGEYRRASQLAVRSRAKPQRRQHPVAPRDNGHYADRSCKDHSAGHEPCRGNNRERESCYPRANDEPERKCQLVFVGDSARSESTEGKPRRYHERCEKRGRQCFQKTSVRGSRRYHRGMRRYKFGRCRIPPPPSFLRPERAR